MTDSVRARPTETGSRPTGQALFHDLGAPRFDPARIAELLRPVAEYVEAAERIYAPTDFVEKGNLCRGSLGYIHFQRVAEAYAIAMEAREGRDAKQGSVEDDSADPKGIAQ